MADGRSIAAQVRDGASHFVVPTGNSWVPLPSWAVFLSHLGAAAGTAAGPSERAVIAAMVPTRECCALLAAAGGVVASYLTQGSPSCESEFQRIKALPDGTWVRWRSNGRAWKAIKRGVELQGPFGPSIVVWDGSRRYLPPRMCVGMEEVSSPSPGERLYREVRPPSLAIGAAWPTIDPDHYRQCGPVSVVIVGALSTLRAESTLPLGFGDDRSTTLGDLVRCRETLPLHEGYRCVCIPSRAHRSSRPVLPANTRLVVFDGAAAYLRWRGQFPAANQLVILDASSDSLELAADSLLQARASRVGGDDLDMCAIPPGVEVLAYTEAVARRRRL